MSWFDKLQANLQDAANKAASSAQNAANKAQDAAGKAEDSAKNLLNQGATTQPSK